MVGAVAQVLAYVFQLKTYTAAHGTLRRARWLVHSDMATDLLNVEKVASTGRFAACVWTG